MNPERINNKGNIVTITLAIFCIFALNFLISCNAKKSDEEQILDVLNGFFKAQASGNYKAGYKFLAPQIKAETSEEDWVSSQLKGINSVRLMRDPRLENIVIKGNTATADFHYLGIPSKTLTAALYQIYSRNFNLPVDQIARETEKDIIEHFDELSAPQTRELTFVRTPDGWSFLLDLRGNFYAKPNDTTPGH